MLSPAHIVAGDLAVADISGRHRNYKITSSQGLGYLLKQGVGKGKASAVAREAAVYRLLSSETTGLHR